MDWQEILDKLRGTLVPYETVNEMNQMLYDTLKSMLQKLASEEKKPEEPVMDGFGLNSRPGGYDFEDADLGLCILENNGDCINFGMNGRHYMQLTQEMVRALLPKLQEFVEKGEIS
jgi:hypothetical protein